MKKFSLTVAAGLIAAIGFTGAPDVAQAHENWGIGGRTSGAVSKTKVPAMPKWLSSARESRKGGAYDVAGSALNKAAASKSNRSDALRELTLVYAEQGKLDEAAEVSSRLRKHCGTSCGAYIDSRLIISKYGDIDRDPVGRVQQYDAMVYRDKH